MIQDKKLAIVGCGWLGSELAKKNINKYREVHGTSRDIKKLNQLTTQGLIGHKLPFEEYDQPQEWLRECNILVLNIPPSDFKFLYAEKMVHLTQNIAENSQIIFISSTSVYANNDGIVTEKTNASGGPRNGKWVLEAEKLLTEAHGNNLTIIRMSGLVGGKRHPVNYMSGKKYEFGGNPVNLIHRDDCVGLIETVMMKNIRGKTINGVCRENPSREEYYTFAAEQLGTPSPVFSTSKSQDFKKVESVLMNEIGYQMKYPSPFDFPIHQNQ